MRRVLFLLSALLLSPVVANAASTASIDTVTCSGGLSSSLMEVASFLCSGDFSLLGGNITSDSKVAVTADGSLFLDNLSITAPAVELTTLNGVLSMGNGVSINTDSFLAGAGGNNSPTVSVSPRATLTIGSGDTARILNGGDISLSIGQGAITPLAGGTITLIPSVPEPSTYLLMLFGILALIGLRLVGNRGNQRGKPPGVITVL